jgi:3-methyladenine DNA glycosylase AlkD
VKKGVLWALRGIATRSKSLREASLATARRLADAENASARWIGKTALREISKRPSR